MHENSTPLAPVCSTTGESPAHGSTQRPNALRSVAASSAQHGPGLADSAESPASNGERQDSASGDVASVRSAGDRYREDGREPREEGRLASLGNAAGERRQPLHPETPPSAMTRERPAGPVSTENVLRLLDFQECRCALTGRLLTPDLASLDHVTPIRVGGEHAIENTQVLHRDVNRAKGSLTNEEFLQLCSEVVAHAAHRLH